MENTERRYIKNELIVKYLRKELTPAESEEITLWLHEDKANCDFLFGLEELFHLYQWNELKLAANTQKEWKKLEELIQHKKQSGRTFSLSRQMLRFAAIVIGAVMISSYTIWQIRIIKELESPMVVTTAKGEASQIVLPDGSRVWLNACSQVSYKKALFSGKRQVQMEGEAYFEVAKDKNAPFVVESKGVHVRVLGTKFNIRAYSDENYLTAMLVEGSILLTSPTIAKEGICMKPGEKVICYDESGVSEFVKEDKRCESIDWMQKRIHFHNRTLNEIIRELEKQFNIEITMPDSTLGEERFTCDFENEENIYQIFDILKLTNKFDYRVRNKHIELEKR